MSLESESTARARSTSQPARWRSDSCGAGRTVATSLSAARAGTRGKAAYNVTALHFRKYETIPLPPLRTIQLVDREEVRSALQSLPQGTLPKNEENKNENLHETEVTSSSCDEDKNEQIKENRNRATKPGRFWWERETNSLPYVDCYYEWWSWD